MSQKQFKFFIEGDPVAKQGVKSRWTGSRVISNMPRHTVEYMNYLRTEILCKLADNLPLPVFPKGTPVKLTVDFYFLRPESVRKGSKYREYHTVKPDYDNCEKSVKDAMTKVMYEDDCQICQCGYGGKWYTNNPREVGVNIVIEEVV